MKFKVLVNGSIPMKFSPFIGVHSFQSKEQIMGTWDTGQCVFHKFPGKGFCIWYSEYSAEEDTQLEAFADIASLEMQVAIKNKINGMWEGIDKPELNTFQYNFRYTKEVYTKVQLKGGVTYITCDIQLEEWFLREHIHDFPILSVLLDKVSQGISCSLSGKDAFCTPEMIRNFQNILYRKYSERTEAKTWELKVKVILLEALDTMSQIIENKEKEQFSLSDYDKECLINVKAILDEQSLINEPLTLKQLSRKAGINEFKLKNGFKQLFGYAP